MEDRHFESLSILEGAEILASKYAKLNADTLVDDMAALSAFVELRRGLRALTDHHRILETLANERAVETSRDLKQRRDDFLRQRSEKSAS